MAHNADLSVDVRQFEYDIVGQVQINRLSDVVNTAIAVDTCLPAALWNDYPHEPSGAPDCRYGAVAGCEQRFDVGVLS
jgi:hypothetical protein